MSPNTGSMRETACPGPEEILALYNKTLSAERREELRRHISCCPRCGAAVNDSLAWNSSVAGIGDSEPTVRFNCGVPSAQFQFGPPIQGGGEASPPRRLGQYELLERIGRGGMGEVYRARNVRLMRPVALKILPQARTGHPTAVARFLREALAIGRLRHPNIVEALDAGEADNIHYLVMELVEGTDLARFATRCGPFPLAEACEIACQTATGLQYAYEHNVVHRDIKPSNLMVNSEGQVKILDLGLALLQGEAGSEEQTSYGAMMGTADFMAPEQWLDTHAVDIRADLYSLGCSLYKLLAGTPPFGGNQYDTSLKKREAHLHVPVPPLQERRPELPAPFLGVIDRLLAKHASDRYATPQDAIEALHPFAEGADLLALARRLGLPVSSESTIIRRSSAPAPLVRAAAAPPPSPQGRLYSLAGAAILSLLLAVGAGWLLLPASAPLAPKKPSPPRLVTNQWIELLDRQPERLWPKKVSPAPFVHWDERKKLFRVACAGTCLFGLADIKRQSYRIQAGISQMPWHGGGGVFIGFRQRNVPGKPQHLYQVFTLLKTRNRPQFSIERQSHLARVGALRGLNLIDVTGASRSDLPIPALAQEYLLDIHVVGHKVKSVRWNGRQLPGLLNEIPTVLNREDHIGTIGLYNTRGQTLFHSFKLMLL